MLFGLYEMSCEILYHDGLLDVAWFCVRKGGSLAGEECKLGGGGQVQVRVRWDGRQTGLC